MRFAVAVLAILTAGDLTVAFAEPPPTPSAPESRSNPAAGETHVAAPANPAPSASSEHMIEEKLLRAQGYKPTMMNGQKVFCRREIPLGSHLPTALNCVTAAEAEAMAREAQKNTERVQRTTPGCLMNGDKGHICQ